MTAAIVCLVLLGSVQDGLDLESEGRYWEAGLRYEEAGSVFHQSRIMARFLEEALYAGHANRSMWLITELEALDVDQPLIQFWKGRLAWSVGLPSHSVEILEGVEGSEWLEHRSRGLAHLYAGDPESARRDLYLSWLAAASVSQRFYSSLDLGYATLAAGHTGEALSMATFLVARFESEGLPVLLQALCRQELGESAAAMMALENLASSETSSAAVADMASAILEDLE